MKDLVLVSNPVSGEEGHPPLGLAYIASYLRKYSDTKVGIIDKEKEIVKAIVKEKPNILGLTSVTVNFSNVMKIAEAVKAELDIPIIIGGEHITSMPQNLPKSIDIGVIGEGERTVLELMNFFSNNGNLNSDELKKINGITFRKDDKTIVTGRRELIDPLDKIPYPARDLFKMKEYLKPKQIISKTDFSRGTHMFTSRGCPFNCVFCSSSNFWCHKIRFNSSEYIVGEINEMIEKYKVDALCIFDDLFIARKDRLETLVDLIKKEKINERVAFRCSVRSDLVSDEICKLLKEMNVRTVSIGFESGSPEILKYLKSNTMKIEDNRKAAQLLHKYGFEIEGLFMIGSPFETKKDLMMTLNFIKNNPIDTIQLSFTTPFPGTGLWNYALEKKLVSNDMDWNLLDLKSETTDTQIFLSDRITKEEFSEVYELIKKEVNKRNYVLNIRPSEVFSWSLIKKGLYNPKSLFNYFYFTMRKKIGSVKK